MKIIGIYTIQSLNFGNRLQNYATQECLKAIGVQALSIHNTYAREEIIALEKKYPFIEKYRNITEWIVNTKDVLDYILMRNANYNFARFNKLIAFSDDYIGTNDIKIDTSRYDVILAGSDQIWNTEFSFVSLNAFLPFKHQRKVAWSASFGVNSIKDDEKIRNCLSDFYMLSVREKSGADIIEKLTGRIAEVVVDPTMLLSATKWREVSRKPKGLKKGKYVLSYFLSPKCKEAEELLEALQKQMNIYDLMSCSQKIMRCSGPAEFLYLIDHAALIITDSFHASVFSFIFNKPFYVYDRMREGQNMNSRLDTLLNKFCLKRKYANSGLENNLWESDYSEGHKLLQREQERAIQFLKISVGED